jgi:hypothetical protein
VRGLLDELYGVTLAARAARFGDNPRGLAKADDEQPRQAPVPIEVATLGRQDGGQFDGRHAAENGSPRVDTTERPVNATGSLGERGTLPVVLGRFAVHAGYILNRLTCHGRCKPIEEAHAVGLTCVEPIQHVGTATVVERILC